MPLVIPLVPASVLKLPGRPIRLLKKVDFPVLYSPTIPIIATGLGMLYRNSIPSADFSNSNLIMNSKLTLVLVVENK